MSISVNYILEQELKKKLQQEQKDVPGVSAIAEERVKQEQSKPAEEQLSDATQQPVAQSKPFDEKYPLAYDAYKKYAKPKNESMLPDPKAQPTEPAHADEEFPSVEQSHRPQEAISNKPSNWTAEEYNAVRQLYSDEQIQALYSKPDPNEFLNGIVSQIYKSNTPEPREPDEKEMKRQTRYAAIGDALSLLSQAAGLAMGAHQKERSFEQSAMGQLSKSQQKLYDDYLKRAGRYNRGAVNAYMQDYIKGEKDWKDTQKEIGRILDTQRKEKIAQAKQEQKDAFEREKLADTNKRTDAYVKNIEEMTKERKERLAIAKQNADLQAARTKAYIEKLNNPSTNDGKKAEYKITIPANPADPDAENVELGAPVRTFEMTKAQQEKYTRDALADKIFMAKHPEFTINPYEKALTDSQRREIAAAYVQELYNKGFGNSDPIDSMVRAGQPRFPDELPADPVEVAKKAIQETVSLDEDFPIVY